MKWEEAQDPEGYPARRLRIGQFDVYLSGESQRDGKFLWHSITIQSIEEGEDPYTMNRYANRVYEQWISAKDVDDAEQEGREVIKRFVAERASKLRKEADELEHVLLTCKDAS